MAMAKNFSLEEFVRSDTAKRLGIDNTPDADSIAHIGELVGCLLQPLREAWGKPIIITSGYRCRALNNAIGGVGNSAHLTGYACDCTSDDFEAFADFVSSWIKDKPFDQLLIERDSKTKWLHIGVRNNKGEQRKQIKTLFV